MTDDEAFALLNEEPEETAPPPPVRDEDQAEWQHLVASGVNYYGLDCYICGDPWNHGGSYCPTGITREQARRVRHERRYPGGGSSD